MSDDAQDHDTFARTLQAAYREVRLHSPQTVPETEERLRRKLDANGITLTADITRALAFAVVEGRDL